MNRCQFLWSDAAKKLGISLGVVGLLAACVPKTSYEDKISELERLQSELRAQQWEQGDCNPETLRELREHISRLDVLSEELIDRNTELSREVARLRRQEAERGQRNLDCEERLRAQANDYESQLERTRETYEDMVEELRKHIQRLERR